MSTEENARPDLQSDQTEPDQTPSDQTHQSDLLEAVPPAEEAAKVAIAADRLSLNYAGRPALDAVTLSIRHGLVTAFIGPSGCGKSSLLRCFNRLNDLNDECELSGTVTINGEDIYRPDVDVIDLRRRVGMVFQRPNPFPKSIFENVAFGPRLQGVKSMAALEDTVEWSLRGAALWDEVKGRLDRSALELSSGQQQRLVIARAIAVKPEILLLDEPCSSLDPISTLKVEELIHDLKSRYTIVIVTHNMQQAARVSDYTAFMNQGRLVEYDSTDVIFTNPKDKQTEDYITGRYG